MDLRYLESCDSTNLWAKAHAGELGPLTAVYTMNQTLGRGRLGRRWENAAGQALYYTAVVQQPLAQPETLPQLMSLVAAEAMQAQFGVTCQIKWPNDLLLDGRKIAGILCESTEGPAGRVWVLGIGVNLAQNAAHFAAQGLPYAGSLAMAGYPVQAETDAPALAVRLTETLARRLPDFAAGGFAPLRAAYRSACVNLGRPVTWQTPAGEARGSCTDVDAQGRLVVLSDAGTQEIFTGEVSVQGIYGSV